MNFKKSLVAFVLALVVPTVLMAQDEEASPKREKFVVDEIVAVVGSSSIMLSDLVSAEDFIKQDRMQRGFSGTNVRGEALENLLIQKLLMTQAALDSLEANEAYVEQQTEMRLNQLIAARGSAEALEKFYNKPIFAIKDIVKVKMREAEMANSMQSTIQMGVEVTPSEVAKFYRKADKDSLPIVPEQYTIAKIAKLPSKSEERKMDVKEKLLDIRSRILNGASFSALARMYSDDISSAVRGGEMDPSPSSNFVQTFKDAVETTKIGQLSEVIETEYGYHILEVLEEQNGYYRVRHILMKIKFNPNDKEVATIQLDSVSNAIKAGDLKFEDAVAEFSEDKDSQANKGIVVNKIYENYGAKYKSTLFTKEDLGRLYDKVSGLKIGETTDVFDYVDDASGEESVLILKLIDILPAHPANIDDDYSSIEEMAINDKTNKKFENWLNEKIENIYVKIEEPYRDIELSNSRWKK